MQLGKYGFVHRAVQTHIAGNYSDVDIELWMNNRNGQLIGRVDIMNSEGQIWEVKHGGNNPYERICIATLQAIGYIGSVSVRTGSVVECLGPSETFSGHFTINIGTESTYYVEYNTPSPGVILYELYEIQYQSDSDYYLTNPMEEVKHIFQLAAAGAAAGIGLAGVGFTGNRYYALK